MRRRALLTAALAAAAAHRVHAQGENAVDVALVLAIDVSRSVTDDEAALQRNGYRAAMTDKTVLAAIAGGPAGAVAVTYFEWARFEFQEVLMPWTRIATVADAQAWSDGLGAKPFQSQSWTSISGALTFGGQLLRSVPFTATRSVIDVSGDGRNNNGPDTVPIRDALVAAGVTINGLPIINRHPRFGRLELDVDQFYRDNVIGGEGSFYIVAEDFSAFSEAIKRKLLQEISGLPASRYG